MDSVFQVDVVLTDDDLDMVLWWMNMDSATQQQIEMKLREKLNNTIATMKRIYEKRGTSKTFREYMKGHYGDVAVNEKGEPTSKNRLDLEKT